jgi:hypothetical protein
MSVNRVVEVFSFEEPALYTVAHGDFPGRNPAAPLLCTVISLDADDGSFPITGDHFVYGSPYKGVLLHILYHLGV